MSTFADTGNVDLAKGTGFALPWPAHRVGVLRRRVDFTVTANQLASGKLMSLFKLPADCMVIKAGMYVKTADAQVTDVDLGLFTLAGDADSAAYTAVDADGFIDGLDISSTTGYRIGLVSSAYNTQGTDPLHVTAANSVVALTNNDADTINDAVIDFYVVCIDVGGHLGTTAGGTGSYTT
jgi:hypothetical protein